MLRVLTPMFDPVLQEIRLQGLNREKNKKILSGVYMIKTARHRTVYLRRDEKSIFERLVYTRSDLSPRFTCRKVM